MLVCDVCGAERLPYDNETYHIMSEIEVDGEWPTDYICGEWIWEDE